MERLGRGAQGGTSQAAKEAGPVNPLYGRLKSQWQPLSEAEEVQRKRQEEHNRGPGAGVLEAVSVILRSCAARGTWARPSLVQAGAIPVLLRLVKETSGNTISGRQSAAHGLALLLISTNPSLLPEHQVLDSIAPLLLLIRGRDRLQQFEAALALTNVSSLNDDACERIVGLGGVPSLVTMVCEDHQLIRRAGAEALCNMSDHPSVVGPITKEYLRLWLAMARAFGEQQDQEASQASPASGAGKSTSGSGKDEDDSESEEQWDGSDFKTSEAAAGALATAASTGTEVAKRLLEGGALSAMAELVASGAPTLQLRALVCMQEMVQVPNGLQAFASPVTLGQSATPESATSGSEDSGNPSANHAKQTESSVDAAGAAAKARKEAKGDSEEWKVIPLQLVAAVAAGMELNDITRVGSAASGSSAQTDQMASAVQGAAVELLKSIDSPEGKKLVAEAVRASLQLKGKPLAIRRG